MKSLFPRLCAAILLTALASPAAVRLPSVISDHMVLQRDRPVRVWGWSDPQEEISVSFRGRKTTVQADAHGRWETFLEPSAGGGPHTMTVAGKNTLTVRDILVGDVWVGSGQSNMVWPVSRSDQPEQEAAGAKFKQIRLFQVEMKVSDYPLDDVTGSWKVCSPESVVNFSAVGYFFARNLHRKLMIPVGVIQSAWGGTPAESWVSGQALAKDPSLQWVYGDWNRLLTAYPAARLRYEQQVKTWEAEVEAAKAQVKPAPRRPNPPPGPSHQWTPAGLYNAMIAPLTPFAIRGVIWYQGENNAGKGRGYEYQRLFQTLILDWRRLWAQGDFPFLFVQLANYARTGNGSQWPELREAQLAALDLRKTGMAVTIDIGNPNDIHPTNKQDVGYRLALAALAIEHGEKIPFSGPIFRQATREGSGLRVWFDHADGGLEGKGGQLKGFHIAGPDRRFVPAQAVARGSTVLVSSPNVQHPVAVRYAWSDSPDGNLYNHAQLPASPFRSDDWRNAEMR